MLLLTVLFAQDPALTLQNTIVGGILVTVTNGLITGLGIYFTFKKDQNAAENIALRKLVDAQSKELIETEECRSKCEREACERAAQLVIAEARIFSLENSLTDHGIPFRRWSPVPGPEVHPSDTHRALNTKPPEVKDDAS